MMPAILNEQDFLFILLILNVKKELVDFMEKKNIKITNEDPLLSREEAAIYLSVKPKTLAMWKCTGRQELKHIKIGRLVKYKKSELDAFILSREVES